MSYRHPLRLAVAALAGAVAGCAAVSVVVAPTPVTIATGIPGGHYLPVGNAICRVYNLSGPHEAKPCVAVVATTRADPSVHWCRLVFKSGVIAGVGGGGAGRGARPPPGPPPPPASCPLPASSRVPAEMCDLRHIEGIKANFGVSEFEYLSTGSLDTSQPIFQVIHSNTKEIVEQQEYVFESFWNRAVPAMTKISEIQEGRGSHVLRY